MSLYEILAIIAATVSTGAGVGIATWTMINSLRKEVRGEVKEVREEIKELREGQQALNERMARVEGLIEGLRESVTRRSAA